MSAVAERLKELREQMRELNHTPCAKCWHPYGYHLLTRQCLGKAISKERACGCRGFVDPVETLDVQETGK